MTIDNLVADALMCGNTVKNIYIRITYKNPNGAGYLTDEYSEADFVADSLMLKQAIQDNDFIDYTGCISSYFEISILKELPRHYIGARIWVDLSISIGGGSSTFGLFYGHIYDIEVSSSYSFGKKFTKLIAYDPLKKLQNINCSTEFSANTTIARKIRYIAENYLDGGGDYPNVTNGGKTFTIPTYNYAYISVLDMLKSLSQVTASASFVDRNGMLRLHDYNQDSYRIKNYEFPSYTTLPSGSLYPTKKSVDNSESLFVQNYKSLVLRSLGNDNVGDIYAIRNTTSGAKKTILPTAGFGGSGATYSLENNLVIDNAGTKNKGILDDLLDALSDNPERFSYEMTTAGLPYVDVGDTLTVKAVEFNEENGFTVKTIPLIVGARTLKGIQNMEDTFSFRAGAPIETRVLDGGAGNAVYAEEEN